MHDLTELVQKAINGNDEALLLLCEKIAKKVYFRIMCIVNNSMDSEDIAQEVLFRVCDNIKSLREPMVFNVWLGKITINEINRFLAKKARHGILLNIEDYYEDLLEDNVEFLPQNYVDLKENHEDIMEIVKNLSERQKQVLLLHYYDNMSVTEIAETMGVTKPTVSILLKRARNNIKQEVERRPEKKDVASNLAIVPVGPMLAQAFQNEALINPVASDVWIRQVIADCVSNMSREMTVPNAAAIISKKFITSATAFAAATAAAAIIVIGMGTAEGRAYIPDAPTPTSSVQTVVEKATGKVILEGDVASINHVNPRSATVFTDSEHGELSVQGWQISELESEDILYSGEGEYVEDILHEMKARRENGQYMIRFLAYDIIGGKYTIGSSFIISVA